MLEYGKINRWQAFFLVITILASSAMVYAPAITANAARQDAWLVVSLILRFPVSFISQSAVLNHPYN